MVCAAFAVREGAGIIFGLPQAAGSHRIAKNMIIEKNKAVSFHYTLTNAEGDQLESSRDHDAMAYLHGANNIISGLEAAMEGRTAGDTFSVTLEPAAAYGERVENIQRVPAKRFGGAKKLRVGMVLNLQTQQGPVRVTVVKIGRFNVDVDANHPLAGETLTFDVEITAVRDATEEEITHRHVHGPGGHSHD
jgi:FKBP-type peptidyl-prolyl cis-trans isomerase SlyD